MESQLSLLADLGRRFLKDSGARVWVGSLIFALGGLANAQTLNLTPTLIPLLTPTATLSINLSPSPTLVILPTATSTPTPTPTLSISISPLPTLVVLPTATPTPTPPYSITPIGTNTTPTPTSATAGFPAPVYLDSNFFNPLQTPLGIHFKMDSGGQARIDIFNMLGEKVAGLLDEYKPAGTYTLSWNGHNGQNALVGNGVYLVLLQTPVGHTLQKVIVLK